MNRDTQSVLLVLLGGAVIRITVDDTYLRYVKSWSRPYLLVAGVLLVLLGIVSLWREHVSRRSVDQPGSGPAEAAATSADEHDHDHGHGPRVAWLLLLPIFAIFLVAPPALGSYAARRDGNDLAKPAEGSGFAPLPDGDPVTTTLTDYALRAIWDDGRTLQGRRVRLVGFVAPRPGGGYFVTRLAVSCCAADARPIKIAVQGGGGGQLATDSWIAVTGSYGGMDDKSTAREKIPIIRADSVRQVAAPAEPYET